jgi:hypothetical protein
VAISLPTGEMMPMPVTTTRRLLMLYSFVIPQNHRRRILRDTHRRYVIHRGRDASRTPYGVGRYKMQKRKLRREGAAFDIPTWTD